jgi:hypothetical protein
MAEHPLLIFPEPSMAERARRSGGGGNVKIAPSTSASWKGVSAI